MGRQVSAYELYALDYGASADRVFAALERHPFAAGKFVWTGWDYLGDPNPFDSSRSSYFGIVDLAGFKKDRFYLYQAHWRPDLHLVHILPHWTWPERVGQVTPVHVFTSGDEAELFLNGRSLGRKKLGAGEYRLRWDDVVYEPGTLTVIAYKNGRRWATGTEQTAGEPARLALTPDRASIAADGRDRPLSRSRSGTEPGHRRAGPTIAFASRSRDRAKSRPRTQAMPQASNRSSLANGTPSTDSVWSSCAVKPGNPASSQ